MPHKQHDIIATIPLCWWHIIKIFIVLSTLVSWKALLVYNKFS